MAFKASKSKKVEALRDVALFSACTNKELGQIASLVQETEVDAGDEIVTEGEPGSDFYAIVEGDATCTLRKKKLDSYGPGTFFGEMALLDRGPRSATVTADTPMKLYRLDARRFSSLLDNHPAVARKVLRGLAQRLRDVERAPTH